MNTFFKDLFDFSTFNLEHLFVIIIFLLVICIIALIVVNDSIIKSLRKEQKETKSRQTDLLKEINSSKSDIAPEGYREKLTKYLKDSGRLAADVGEALITPIITVIEEVVDSIKKSKPEEGDEYKTVVEEVVDSVKNSKPHEGGPSSIIVPIHHDEPVLFERIPFDKQVSNDVCVDDEDEKTTTKRFNYKKMTVLQLRARAKELGMSGYSSLNKEELTIAVKKENRRQAHSKKKD